MEDLQALLTILNTGGLVGALIFGLWLGLTGKVIPVSLLRAVISAVVEEVLRELDLPPK